jgi:hypothetical protein
MQPGMEAPAGALARRGSHVRLADASGTPIGPNRADAGNAPHSIFANRGEPGANPKTRWPRGRAGPSFPQKVAGLYTKPSKKVHRIRGGTSSGNRRIRWEAEHGHRSVLYRAPRRAMGAGKASSSGPSAAGHAFHRPSGTLAPAIWPVRRMRLEGLAGDAYDGSQAKGNIRWQDGHTKKT